MGEAARVSVSERVLTVFVPTKLVSALNAREHWAVRSKRAHTQRDAVTAAVWHELAKEPKRGRWRIQAPARTPKHVSFTAHVARKMDDDNLRAALKAVRDGLQDCGLIHSDGPESGHTFTYAQRVQKPHGVEIRVEVA